MEILGSIPVFGGFVFTVIAFVATLSVIIFIHEYGHYIVGRWCGIHAEVFSMGFGPVIKSWTDKRGTVWQISALPFGGYVKFLGDADGSSRTDTVAMDSMDAQSRSRSFPGAKLYKKALTVAAGPVANFILSIGIFTLIVLFSGLATETPEIGALKPLPDGESTMQPGDVIVAVNGTPTPDYDALFDYARATENTGRQTYEIKRGDSVLMLEGPFPLLPLVDNVQPQSTAIEAGIQVGDLIQSVDGQAITAFRELQTLVGESNGQEMVLNVWRNGETIEFKLAAKIVDLPTADGGFEKRALIGITGGLFFEPRTYTPGPIEALKLGATQTQRIVTGSLSGLKHIITGSISACNLQGPVGIAQTSGEAASQGVVSFIWFIAVLSTAIGMLNLFPIPVLDGGHLLFFAYEAITRRAPSEKALRILMTGGLFLILALMAFALSNDFLCN